MGDIVSISLYLIKDFYSEIKESIQNNTDLDIKKISQKLSSFYLSGGFFNLFVSEVDSKSFNSITMFEMKEKYLSLQVIFQLLEELKNKNFEIQIKEALGIKKEANRKGLERLLNDKSANNFAQTEEGAKMLNEIEIYYNKNSSHINNLMPLYELFVSIAFKEAFKGMMEEGEFNVGKKFFETYKALSQDFKADEVINVMNKINSLKHLKNAYQIALSFLNIKKNEKEISLKEKIDENFFSSYYEDYFNLNNKIIWRIYEEDLNEIQSKNIYIKYILKGKMTEKEKYNFDIFNKLIKIKTKEEIKWISGVIFKSLFYNKEILLIKIDLESVKRNNLSLETIQNEIEIIKNSNPEKFSLDTYVQIENQVINLDVSYNIFINKLEEKKIIFEENIIIEKNDKINNNINKNEIEKLKQQLSQEKDKNKKLEEIIMNLKKDSNNEINIDKESKNKIEEEPNKNLKKETKDSLIEAIIEKEKENKELRLKLSKSPFILEEGEKLMSINFISEDKKFISSIICKNSDEFYKIEGQLYKNHSEYFKNKISFTFNGKKINRYKTLEQNGIKNDDVIIMKEIDD